MAKEFLKVVIKSAFIKGYLCFPAPICIYRPWLIRTGNNKSQSLDIMLLFLFLLSNLFVTLIIDRNEAKVI